MWQRFTERSRRVVFFAQQEASRLGHNTVHTEHLLLGLVREDDSTAARALNALGVFPDDVHARLQGRLAPGADPPGRDSQLSAASKRVIDRAYDEARRQITNYIGSEHLLLGLLHQQDEAAGQVLMELGLNLERARAAVEQVQAAQPDEDEKSAATNPPAGPDKADVDPAGPLDEAAMEAAAKSGLRGGLERLRETLRGMVSDPVAAAQGGAAMKEALRAAEQDTPATAPGPQVGDLGALRDAQRAAGTDAAAAPERSLIELAADEPALRALVAAFRARDHFGYQELRTTERFVLVPAGAQAKILALVLRPPGTGGLAGYRVRVLDGEHEGRAGYVRADDFERAGPDDDPFPPVPGAGPDQP